MEHDRFHAGCICPSTNSLFLCANNAFVVLSPRCSYTLHNKGRIFENVKEQIEPIAVDLMAIAANACVMCMPLGRYMAKHTALRVCKLYKDLQTVWVSHTAPAGSLEGGCVINVDVHMWTAAG